MRRRREAVIQRGQIDERLDRRAGLALRLDRAIELADLVAEAAGRARARGRYADRARRPRRRLRASGAAHRAAAGSLAAALASGSTSTTSPARSTSPAWRGTGPNSPRRAAACAPSASRRTGSVPRAAVGKADLGAVGDRSPAPPRAASRPRRCRAGGATAARRGRQSPVGVDMRHRPAPAVAAIIIDQPVAQRRVGDGLQLGIEAGAHGEARLVERLLAIARQQLAAHLLGEVTRRHHLGVVAPAQRDRLRLRPLAPGSLVMKPASTMLADAPSRAAPWPPRDSAADCSCSAPSAGPRGKPPHRCVSSSSDLLK